MTDGCVVKQGLSQVSVWCFVHKEKMEEKKQQTLVAKREQEKF